MTDKLSFGCKACGATVVYDTDNPPDDAEHLFCTGCGKDFGPFGEVKAAALNLARQEVERITQKHLGIKPTWKKR